MRTLKNDAMECKICKKDCGSNNIRLEVCWNCAEAESIIDDGSDMWDEPIRRESGDSLPMSKLKALINKGWRNGS